ncbi:MAG: DciA family protein [Planctomycetota bacterium]|jgi:predicted nucleic acid-binding Zn ribbon protein
MARGPKAIGNILSELMARRGYTQVQSARAYDDAWREVAGELVAEYTRVGSLRRGTLEVIVGNSTLVQELTFQKPTLLKLLVQLMPDERLEDLRFRVGTVDQ